VFLFPLIANAIEILQEEETESDDTKSDTTESIENNIKYNKKSKESKKKKLEEIAKCHELLKGRLDERARRCWMGAEAVSLGRGGLALVTKACKANHTTVQEGMREVREPAAEDLERIRQPGGGSKPIEKRLPGIEKELEKLVDPDTRGDPESPLRWTTKSLHHLADALTKRGFPVGKDAVGILLKKLGYSLKAPSKTLEGNQHPDRDEQFRYIAQKSQAFLDAGEPVISVDTKKKEKVGNYRNAGTEYEPKGHVQEVEMHDFGDRDEEGRIIHGIPYGVYDIKANNGWVSVGVDHDTSVFAVSTIRNWLKNMGKPAYPNCKKILITADSGGSNGSRVRAFKVELQRLADETGIAFHVAHLPPGTSKWNKIEHRMFSQITLNWRGRPLTCHETIVNLIASTTTKTGLKIQAMLDTERYPIGIKISKKEFGSIKINGDIFHPEWNYAIIPSDARMEK
jgi:transposase